MPFPERRIDMHPLGEPAERLLTAFVDQSKAILKDNLVGVYLHGSAVMGCYNPQKSDLDLIVVVEKPVLVADKRAFMDAVTALHAAAPGKGIEMSVVLRLACRPFHDPMPFELHFSAMHLDWYRRDPEDYVLKMNGTDVDLAAHFTVLRERGRCLWGLPVETVFDPVPAQDYWNSIWSDIASAREEIAENPMYCALNLARALAYWRERLILSKQEGGEWALKNLPEAYHGLICDALREYRDGARPDYDLACEERYANDVLNQLSSRLPVPRPKGV